MKKIIYLTIVDVSKKNGQGIYALKTLESISAGKDIELEIILPRPADKDCLRIIDRNKNCKIHYLKRKKQNRNIFWHIIIQLQLFIILMRIGKRDGLIYSLKPTMLAPLAYSLIYNVRVYLLVEGLAKNTIKTLMRGVFLKIGEFVLSLNIRNAKSIYPAYKSARDWVYKISPKKNIIIIPCGVNFEVLTPQLKIPTKNLIVGYVGSFRKVHLIMDLIKAVKFFNVDLLLVGDGKEKNIIKQYIKINCINNVKFLGEKKQNDLPKIFSECDVMWAGTDSSHWGIPIKCFEYLACNKKVIYTKKEDLRFIYQNNYGFQLNKTDIDSIKDVLEKILVQYNNGELKDNKDSRKHIKQSHDWNNFKNIILSDI